MHQGLQSNHCIPDMVLRGSQAVLPTCALPSGGSRQACSTLPGVTLADPVSPEVDHAEHIKSEVQSYLLRASISKNFQFARPYLSSGMVRRTWSRFESQHSHGSSGPFVTPVPGDNEALFRPPWADAHDIHVHDSDIHANTHIH